MFETQATPESRSISILKKIFVAVVALLLLIGAVSSHRAYYQVRSLEIKTGSSITAGSNFSTNVVTSGRTTVDVRVELVQGNRLQPLMTMRVRGNELGFFDPRQQHATQDGVITAEHLKDFAPGPAKIRAIAVGRPQWMRLPPPTVTEIDVNIEPMSDTL